MCVVHPVLVQIADTAILIHDVRVEGFNRSLLDAVCSQGLPSTLHLAMVNYDIITHPLTISNCACIFRAGKNSSLKHSPLQRNHSSRIFSHGES